MTALRGRGGATFYAGQDRPGVIKPVQTSKLSAPPQGAATACFIRLGTMHGNIRLAHETGRH